MNAPVVSALAFQLAASSASPSNLSADGFDRVGEFRVGPVNCRFDLRERQADEPQMRQPGLMRATFGLAIERLAVESEESGDSFHTHSPNA